jgi:hypothetical protein
MADTKLVKKFLDDIESARANGRSVEPPARLQNGNILGAKTAAFKEAVKEQGKKVNPPKAAPYTQSGELFDMAEKAKGLRTKVK